MFAAVLMTGRSLPVIPSTGPRAIVVMTPSGLAVVSFETPRQVVIAGVAINEKAI